MVITSIVINFLANNASEVVSGLLLSGACAFGYRKAMNIIKPQKYIEKLYAMGDKVIIDIDDKYIDKIRSKKLKDEIQKDIRDILLRRKKSIDLLIEKISD